LRAVPGTVLTPQISQANADADCDNPINGQTNSRANPGSNGAAEHCADDETGSNSISSVGIDSVNGIAIHIRVKAVSIAANFVLAQPLSQVCIVSPKCWEYELGCSVLVMTAESQIS
jgi:hypothetical protein